jgi:hypothetical protein
VTIEFTDEKNIGEIEQAGGSTASGNLRQQQTGERLRFECRAAVTVAVYRSLLNLIKNPLATTFFYTPEETYDLYSNVDFPISVRVSNLKPIWDNREIHHIEFLIESVELI